MTGKGLRLVGVFCLLLLHSLPLPAQPANETSPSFQDRDRYYQDLLQQLGPEQGFLASKWREYRNYPLLDRAYRLLAAGQASSALAELNKILAVEPGNMSVLWQKANILITLGRTADAKNILARIFTARPGFGPAYLSLAEIFKTEDRDRTAASLFLDALDTGILLPNDRQEAIRETLSIARRSMSREFVAYIVNRLNAIEQLTPPEALQVARLLNQWRLDDEGDRLYREIMEAGQSDQVKRLAILEHAEFMLGQGQLERAMKDLERGENMQLFATGKPVEDGERAAYQYLWAKTLIALSDHANLRERLSDDFFANLSLFRRVELSYKLAQRDQKALALAMLLNPDGSFLDTASASQETVNEYYLAVYQLASDLNRIPTEQAARRALLMLNVSPQTVLRLSNIALDSGWLSGALQILEDVRARTSPAQLQQHPMIWAEYMRNLSHLALEAGDRARAVTALNEAIRLDPRWQSVVALGRLLIEKDRMQEGATLLENGVSRAGPVAPGSPDAELLAGAYVDLARAKIVTAPAATVFPLIRTAWDLAPSESILTAVDQEIMTTRDGLTLLPRWLDLIGDEGPDDQTKAAALLVLARTLKAEKDLEASLTVYLRSIDLHPVKAAVLEAAYLALDLDQPRRALALAAKLNNGEDAPAIAAIKCQAASQLGDKEQQLACLIRSAEDQPQSVNAQLNAAYAALALQRTEQALALFKSAYALQPSAPLALEIGVIEDQAGRSSKALQWYETAFRQFDSEVAGLYVVNALHKLGQIKRAFAVIQTIDPRLLSSEDASRYFEARARLRLRVLGQNAETLSASLADMRRAGALRSSFDIRFSIVNLLFQSGEIEEAETAYAALPGTDRAQAQVLALGGYIARANGQPETAAQRFAASLEINPAQPLLKEDLAYTYLQIYENDKAAELFRERLVDMQSAQLSLAGQEKKARFQRQLRILEIPLSFTAFSGLSPSPQTTVFSGGALGIPSSSPFGSVEVAWRPPIIGYANGRSFEVVGRTQWANERGSFRPDDETVQAVAGVRIKPLRTQNLKFGLERFFKIGDQTEDNWLARVLWSYTQGNDFLPFVDPETGTALDGMPYYSAYLEMGRFLQGEKTTLFYGDGRVGYTFHVNRNLIFSPFVYAIGSGNWSSTLDAFAAEAGAGISLKLKTWDTKLYGDLVTLEVFGRLGGEFYTNEGSRSDRILLGLQASF